MICDHPCKIPRPNTAPTLARLFYFLSFFQSLTNSHWMVHNHPSGDPMPSQGDIDMTKQIVAAGKPLKITVHDHLIVGREGVASLKQIGAF